MSEQDSGLQSSQVTNLTAATNRMLDLVLTATGADAERVAGEEAFRFLREYGAQLLSSIEDSARIDLFQRILFAHEHAILDIPEEILKLAIARDGEDNLKVRTMLDAFDDWYAENGISPEVLQRAEAAEEGA